MRLHRGMGSLILTLMAFFFGLSLFWYASPKRSRHKGCVNAKSSAITVAAPGLPRLPGILLWNMFFGFPTLGLSDSSVGEVTLAHCEPQCYLTNDICRLNSSDAVVVHMFGLDAEDLPQKTPHQKWVFWLMEPPRYENFRDYDKIAGYFNWTMTYRSDSDVPTPYGETVRNTDAPLKKDLQSLWNSKSKMAAWMVSNCKTRSKRELFVAEMRRYIDVDIYGHCGNNFCPMDKGPACYEEFERKYFFILAFENSICTDYVTEKYFWALQYDLV